MPNDEQEADDMSTLHARLLDVVQNRTLREIEEAVILLRLERSGGSVPKAAESLGISLPTAYKKARLYGISSARRDAEDRRAGR